MLASAKNAAYTVQNVADDDSLARYLRHRIDEWLRQDRSRTASELARLSGLTPTHISTIRAEKRGTGMKALRGLAKAWGTTVGRLEEEATAWAREHPSPPESRVVYDQTTIPRFDNLPGWVDALARAKVAFPRVTEDEWAAAGRRSAEEFPADGLLEPELLLKLVQNVRDIRAAPRTLRTEEDVRKAIEEEGDAVPPPRRR